MVAFSFCIPGNDGRDTRWSSSRWLCVLAIRSKNVSESRHGKTKTSERVNNSMKSKHWKWKSNLKYYFGRGDCNTHLEIFTDEVIYDYSSFQFLPKLLIFAAGFPLRWGVQGALLQGSKEQHWSSMRPRWPWQIMFMNLSCSSGDSIYWKQRDKYFMNSRWTALNETLKPQWHNRTEHTVIGVEHLGWEGTCRWLDDTDRSFLFLSGVLPVTEVCGAEPWWSKIPGSWEKKVTFGVEVC